MSELKDLLDEYDSLSGKIEQVGRQAALLAWRRSRKGGGKETQAEIAADVGRSQNAISRWCRVGEMIDRGDQRAFHEIYATTKIGKTRVLTKQSEPAIAPATPQEHEAKAARVAQREQKRMAKQVPADDEAKRRESDEIKRAIDDRSEEFDAMMARGPIRLPFEIDIEIKLCSNKGAAFVNDLKALMERCEPDQQKDLLSAVKPIIEALLPYLVEDVINHA